MSVSVIIPAYNAAATIGTQLEAILRQADDDTEIIVSDNGSSDETAAVVGAYAFSHPCITQVDASAVRGPAHARNAGVRAARGDFLLFCDADDEAGDGWFESMTARLSAADAVAGGLNKFIETNGQRTDTDTMAEPPRFNGIPWPVSANLAIRRSVLERIGGFDESLRSGEDIDLGIRLYLANIELAFEQSVMHYRMRSSPAAERRQLCVYNRWQVILEQRNRTFLASQGVTVPSTVDALRDLAGHLRRTSSVVETHGVGSWWTWTSMRAARIQGHFDWYLHHSSRFTPRLGLRDA
ncbi:MAG: glycosyltransferase [Acidipropionibacterium sp.]|jgi:glycosyltransferase involved in cell wall biosynthesis|nr:glycosyltransferase [Acidipropionibacterium sp.]